MGSLDFGYLHIARRDCRGSTENRILKCSRKPRNNLSRAKQQALHKLHGNSDLTVLPPAEGNAMVTFHTTDYMENIMALLEDPAHKRLAKDSTQSVEWRTMLFIKRSSLLEDVTKQLWPHGLRPLR